MLPLSRTMKYKKPTWREFICLEIANIVLLERLKLYGNGDGPIFQKSEVRVWTIKEERARANLSENDKLALLALGRRGNCDC